VLRSCCVTRPAVLSVTLLLLLATLLLLPSALFAQSQPAADEPTPHAAADSPLGLTPHSDTPPPPHPLLSDVNVRRAIAYCVDRPALVAALYAPLSQSERDALLMDTFVPRDHPFYTAPSPAYQYALNPAQAAALLEGAGWSLTPGATYRTNAQGEQLTLKFLSTNSQFRESYSARMEQQLRDNCGVRLLRNLLPANITFASLPRRAFESVAFAWVGQPWPAADSLYTCRSIPGPENGFSGQNSMGWCHPAVDAAFGRLGTTLNEDAIVQEFATIQEEFAREMVSLPLFQRVEGYATDARLLNYKPDPTEYDTWNAWEWSLPGVSTLVVYGDEPLSLSPASSAASRQRIGRLLFESPYTTVGYDYQPQLLTALPTIDSGLAQTRTVQVGAGRTVIDADGAIRPLAPGVVIRDATGITRTFTSGTLPMQQLVVPFRYHAGLRWSDGAPLAQADFALGYDHDCDPSSQGIDVRCDLIDTFTPEATGYTIAWLPGYLAADYFLAPFNVYPAHQLIQSDGPHKGKTLAQVPHGAWLLLPEHTRTPLGMGPYRILSWQPGVQMELAPNPHYWRGAANLNFSKIVIRFGSRRADDIANNVVHIADGISLGQLDVPTVKRFFIRSATWEHLDFNLNLFTQAAAKTLSTAGGTLQTATGLKLTVPPNATAGAATFVLDEIPAPAPELAGRTPLRTLELAAFGGNGQPITSFAAPLTLEMTYADEALLASALSEESLTVERWDGTQTTIVFPCPTCTHDKDANVITLPLRSFSMYVLSARQTIHLPTVRR
jgi:ABC-type transport system substrate-binding protein